MVKSLARFLWLFLLLMIIGAAAGAYYYYNYCIDGIKLVQRALRNEQKLKSYYSNMEIRTAHAGEGQRYFVQVWFNAPSRYRVEVFTTYIGEGTPAQVFISDGERRWIYSPEIGDFYLLSPLQEGEQVAGAPFLLTHLLQDLAQARKVELLGMERQEGRRFYLLKVIPEQTARGHAWEKVWLERSSLLPVKIQVYDEYDKLNRTVTFNIIELNPKLNDELFRIVDNSLDRTAKTAFWRTWSFMF